MLLKQKVFFKCFGVIFFSFVLFGNLAWARQTKEIPSADPVTRAWQIVDTAIKDRDPDKRRAIVMAASLGGPYEKVFSFLAEALKDKKVPVRLSACASLASFKDPRTLASLKEALKDPVPEVFFCAAQGLWALGDPLGEKVLLEVLKREKGISSGFLTTHQRQAMSAFNSKRSFFSTLFRLGIRFAPVPGLAMGYSSMMELTKDHKASGQALAAVDLARATDAESLQALVEVLQNKNATVRAAAVHALAMRNDPTVRHHLVPLLDDKADAVKYRAAVAYLRLDHVAKEAPLQPSPSQSVSDLAVSSDLNKK